MRTSRIVLGAGLALIGCGSSSKDNGAAGGTAGAAATSGAGGAAGSGGNTVDCTAGPCQCDTSPTCTLDCGTSGCSQAECLGGACQADCTGGNCNLDCSDGAQCNFDCSDGAQCNFDCCATVTRSAHSSAAGGRYDALRTGDNGRAEQAFAKASRSGTLAEDATYWRAVSLMRGGHRDAATRAFQEFLVRFPESPRRGEASAMLGKLLLAAGDSDAARKHFQAATEDSRPDVRKAAEDALKKLP